MNKEKIETIIGEYIINTYFIDDGIYEKNNYLSDYLSSLEMVEIAMFIEERFGIAVPDDVWVEWRHLSDATEYVYNALKQTKNENDNGTNMA